MKLKRFYVSVALVLLSLQGLCHIPLYYSPREYYIYRVYDKNNVHGMSYYLNCQAWKEITSSAIPSDDIMEVVYKYDINQVLSIMSDFTIDNAFAIWIRENKDQEIVDFLVLAKSCEKFRGDMASRWYYPSKNDISRQLLSVVKDNAMAYDKDRLRDRYALQLMRAMHTLGQYEEMLAWWDKNGKRLKTGIIRDMTEDYVNGALSRLNKQDSIKDMTAPPMDLYSIRKMIENSGNVADNKAVFDFIVTYCPNNPNAPEVLQELFGTLEEYRDRGSDYNVKELSQYNYYIEPCLKVAESSPCKEPAMWYYTASYLLDLTGNTEDAYKYIKKAETLKAMPYIKESVTTLRIYLEAKVLSYDGSDDSKFIKNLKWIDQMLCSNITDEVRKTTLYDINTLDQAMSYYYWGDMMRKVVLGEMVPRMLEAGRGRTAIAMANMADYRLLTQVNDRWFSAPAEWTKNGAVYAKYYDGTRYQNHSFLLMDTIATRHLRHYVTTVGRAPTLFDRFIDERSGVNMDYLYELLGTRYLRDLDYANAVKALSKVSPHYQYSMATSYMKRQPFAYKKCEKEVIHNYKLTFAQKMLKYEKQSRSDNPDVSGQAMMMMGLGLRSSFDYCWYLTHYYRGSLNMPMMSNSWDFGASHIFDMSEKMMIAGIEKIQDPELAAQCCAMILQQQRAVTQYPNTKAAQNIRTHCDTYEDYTLGRIW